MASNSKLSPEQKRERKQYLYRLAEVNGDIGTSDCGRVTVVAVPEFEHSRMVRVSVSWASRDEKKLRRKVGEYHALKRWVTGNTVVLPSIDTAVGIANFFTEFDSDI